MIGADTNLIVRFLVRDNEEQAQKVRTKLKEGAELYINEVMLSELYWVLTKVYKYSDDEFGRAVYKLTETEGFRFFDNQVVKDALNNFMTTPAGFTDALICCINRHKNLNTLTFDEKASRLDGMKLLR